MNTLRLIGLCALLMFTSTESAFGETPSDKPAPMPSTVFDWEKIDPVIRQTGAVRRFFDSPTLTLDRFRMHVTTVNPGLASHPPHRHPGEELIIVKEGTIEVLINDQTRIAGPGSVFYFASNDLHGMRNVGDTPATYYVLRWDTPATPTPTQP